MWTHRIIVSVLMEIRQYELIEPLWCSCHLPCMLFHYKELDIVCRRSRWLVVRTAAIGMRTVDGMTRGVADFFRSALGVLSPLARDHRRSSHATKVVTRYARRVQKRRYKEVTKLWHRSNL